MDVEKALCMAFGSLLMTTPKRYQAAFTCALALSFISPVWIGKPSGLTAARLITLTLPKMVDTNQCIQMPRHPKLLLCPNAGLPA